MCVGRKSCLQVIYKGEGGSAHFFFALIKNDRKLKPVKGVIFENLELFGHLLNCDASNLVPL